MTIELLPANLPTLFADAGVDVDVIGDWRPRSRPSSSGDFDPVGVLWHHTGGTPDTLAYARWMALEGRPDLPPPLAHGGITRKGKLYLSAGGRANHAGKAKASGTVAGGDGNKLYVGFECMNTGSEGWSPAQYGAMVSCGAVMMKVLGSSEQAQRAHRETSLTGKWDPGMLDMDDFRDDIADRHAALFKTPAPTKPAAYPFAARTVKECDDLIRLIERGRTKGSWDVRALLRGKGRDSLLYQLKDLRNDARATLKD